MSLSRHVHRASDQTTSDEAVVDRYDEERDYVEDKEEGHGVDFRVQRPLVWVGCTGHECLVSVAGGESMEVREDGFRNGQGERQQPDGCHSYTDTGPVDVQWFDDGFVPGRRDETRKQSMRNLVFVSLRRTFLKKKNYR